MLAVAAIAAAPVMLASCHDKAKQSDASEETQEETTDAPAPVNNPSIITDTLQTDTVTAMAPKGADGYTATSSGLKYRVIRQGKGGHPTASSVVTVKYTGKLQDGTVFDSTDAHGGQPASFPLNQVIPGWTEGMQLMQPGAVYEFVIPSGLAYGKRGVPGAIPPDATLIFEVELLGFN